MNRRRTYALCVTLLLCLLAIGNSVRVEAAPPADPEPAVPPCEPINQAGVIIIYRCLPDEGLPYKINSVGFMETED